MERDRRIRTKGTVDQGTRIIEFTGARRRAWEVYVRAVEENRPLLPNFRELVKQFEAEEGSIIRTVGQASRAESTTKVSTIRTIGTRPR